MVKGKDNNFYLVYFKSAAEAWDRSVKDEWIVAEMEDLLHTLIEDGGYHLDKAVLDKIGAPAATTESTTAATK